MKTQKQLFEAKVRRIVKEELSNTQVDPKIYVSKILEQFPHKGNANLLRRIIFEASTVDWNKVKGIINTEHPQTNKG